MLLNHFAQCVLRTVCNMRRSFHCKIGGIGQFHSQLMKWRFNANLSFRTIRFEHKIFCSFHADHLHVALAFRREGTDLKISKHKMIEAPREHSGGLQAQWDLRHRRPQDERLRQEFSLCLRAKFLDWACHWRRMPYHGVESIGRRDKRCFCSDRRLCLP